MRKGSSKWEKHVPFIKANAGKMTRSELAEAIGTNRQNLYNICYYFKIRLPREDWLRAKRVSKWEKHLPFICENTGVLPRSEIAVRLGISSVHLRNLCYQFDIPAPPEDVAPPAVVRPGLLVNGEWVDPFAGTKPRGGRRYAGR